MAIEPAAPDPFARIRLRLATRAFIEEQPPAPQSPPGRARPSRCGSGESVRRCRWPCWFPMTSTYGRENGADARPIKLW